MPANPSHTGLVAQGWNWTLSDAKTYVQTYKALNIGQMYTTESGATEVDLSLDSKTLHPHIMIYVNGTVDIDWGDGSTHTSITGTSTGTL